MYNNGRRVHDGLVDKTKQKLILIKKKISGFTSPKAALAKRKIEELWRELKRPEVRSAIVVSLLTAIISTISIMARWEEQQAREEERRRQEEIRRETERVAREQRERAEHRRAAGGAHVPLAQIVNEEQNRILRAQRAEQERIMREQREAIIQSEIAQSNERERAIIRATRAGNLEEAQRLAAEQRRAWRQRLAEPDPIDRAETERIAREAAQRAEERRRQREAEDGHQSPANPIGHGNSGERFGGLDLDAKGAMRKRNDIFQLGLIGAAIAGKIIARFVSNENLEQEILYGQIKEDTFVRNFTSKVIDDIDRAIKQNNYSPEIVKEKEDYKRKLARAKTIRDLLVIFPAHKQLLWVNDLFSKARRRAAR